MRRGAGFTLLEILVAVAVLGLLLVLLGQGTAFGLRAADRQWHARSDNSPEVAAADALLRNLVAAADPGIFPEPASLRGGAASLRLVTEVTGGDGTRRRIDAELYAGGGQLRLRWRPHRQIARFGPAPPAEEVVLLDGVERLGVAFVAPGRTEWQAAWADDALPALVRLELVFRAPNRHWPPIVVAPELQALDP